MSEHIAVFSIRERGFDTGEERRFVFAEIVLLVKTEQQVHPFVYRLHKEAFEQKLQMAAGQSSDLILGSLFKIDKRAKKIYLMTNEGAEITVSYTHLVAISPHAGTCSTEEKKEKMARGGLRHLFESLKIQECHDEALAFSEKEDQRKNKLAFCNARALDSHNAISIKEHLPTHQQGNSIPLSMAYDLCEVQC